MKGVECKRRQLALEEERAVNSRAFSPYGRPLEMMTSLRYLGRVILAADDDWTAVIRNLSKAHAVWRRMMRILSREEERPRVYRFFFKAVLQSVLLFCAKTWVVIPCMVRVLGGFQDQVERQRTRISRGGGDMEVGLHLNGDGKSGF